MWQLFILPNCILLCVYFYRQHLQQVTIHKALLKNIIRIQDIRQLLNIHICRPTLTPLYQPIAEAGLLLSMAVFYAAVSVVVPLLIGDAKWKIAHLSAVLKTKSTASWRSTVNTTTRSTHGLCTIGPFCQKLRKGNQSLLKIHKYSCPKNRLGENCDWKFVVFTMFWLTKFTIKWWSQKCWTWIILCWSPQLLTSFNCNCLSLIIELGIKRKNFVIGYFKG